MPFSIYIYIYIYSFVLKLIGKNLVLNICIRKKDRHPVYRYILCIYLYVGMCICVYNYLYQAEDFFNMVVKNNFASYY